MSAEVRELSRTVAVAARADSAPIEAWHLDDDPDQWFFVVRPHVPRADRAVLVSVHGIKRDAWEHARLLQPWAQRYGVTLICPHFTRRRHRRFQLLAGSERAPACDTVLLRILDALAESLVIPAAPIALFGYSGGGQFAHRFALKHPDRVAALAVGAAGWYTMPEFAADYPLGLAGLTDSTRLDAFLRLPTAVFVGANDNQCDHRLNRDPAIDRTQGKTRIERGWRWLQATATVAAAHGIEPRHVFQTLPDCDHSFARCIRKSALAHRLFEFLYTTRW